MRINPASTLCTPSSKLYWGRSKGRRRCTNAGRYHTPPYFGEVVEGYYVCSNCGAPGAEKELIEVRDYDPDEFWGSPCMRPAFWDATPCCGEEPSDMYTFEYHYYKAMGEIE